jgi:putative membrane-bound dehydrogenase-like protein
MSRVDRWIFRLKAEATSDVAALTAEATRDGVLLKAKATRDGVLLKAKATRDGVLLRAKATTGVVLIALLFTGACVSAAAERGAASLNQGRAGLSPDEALATFELEPGYRIELAAAEPLIRDPVAIAFDDRERMYVVENRGYPGPLEGAPRPAPEGVIALLEDSDRDGRFDRRTDFAGRLASPNGVMPWNGGVFVTDAPDLLYLKDTTGDGVADERRVVLTGFDATRTAQIRFSHPTLGIDNWVYLTSGLIGGNVTAPEHPDRPAVKFGPSDSRFDPFTLAFELAGGQGQYGLTFDDHGRRFTSSNRRPVMHAVLEPRYLKRNPHLAFSATVADVSATGAQAVVWPISADMTTASFHPGLLSTPHAGTFTAASGVHIHRGDALPSSDDHRDSIFICESAQNLVQRQIRSPDGVTFKSRPARIGREFLASHDQSFRPVFAANGPDGALYIVDMYRRTIDHPQYVPEPSRPLLDFETGKGQGRIYRIAARTWKAERTSIDLGRMRASELTQTLEHPNAWWRETAQRVLVERRDPGTVPSLRALAERGRAQVARIHALWTLHGLGALADADIARALRDTGGAVRENAVRLAESRVKVSQDLLTPVLRLVDDPDERVRLRVALALGETDDPRTVDGLASLARRDGGQQWMRAAILSSVRERSNEFLRAFVASPPSSSTVRGAVMQDLGQLFGAGQTPERCLDLMLQIADPAAEFGWQPAALSGIAEALRTRGLGRDGRSAFMTLLLSDSPRARSARQRVETILARASTLALDRTASAELRLAAIGLMGHTDYASAGQTLEELLTPQHPSEVQVAAVRALSQLPGPAAAASLLDGRRWLSFTPRIRDAVLSRLESDESQTVLLLDAIERGPITPAELGPARRGRLTSHRNALIQARARSLFAAVDASDRMKIYERLRASVPARTTTAGNGKQVFAAHCAGCHAFAGTGGQVGPDLTGIRNQPADAILLHVLVPEYEITPGYQSYNLETREGRVLFGRLESEAPNSVTLRDGSSQSHVILRSDVVSMKSSPVSLMPNELERAMSEQELADLIGYLKTQPR